MIHQEKRAAFSVGVLLVALVVLALFAAARPPDVIVTDGPYGRPKPAPVKEAPSGGSPTSQAVCEEAGGKWNECGSSCRAEPPGTICAQVCVPYCECASNDQCPAKLTCQYYVNKVGVCRTGFEQLQPL